MICVTGINGERHALHPNAIAKVTEAGVSGRWHGINTYIKLFNGQTLEVRDSMDEVCAALAGQHERGAA